MKLSELRKNWQQNSEFTEAAEGLKLHFELANAVLRARMKKGWSQTDLARAIGTKQANISRIEAGLANPTFTFVQKLASILDLGFKITINDRDASSQSGAFLPQNLYYVPDWPKSPCTTRYETISDASIEEGRLQ